MKPVLLASAAALVLAGPAAAQTVLSIGHALAPGSHYSEGAVAFKETLERLSDGQFVVEEHPSSSLGGERDMIEGLQIGSVDLVITSTGPLGNFVPEVFVLDLPFLFRDYDHARTTLDGEIGQELLEAVDENDLVGLAWTENGFRHVTNSVRPVTAPEDLAGLKLRTMENRVHMTAFEAMGAAPTPMAWPEVFTALQQGVVDGQENPITVITAANFHEVQGHLTLTGHVYSPAIVLASPFVLEGLSDEEREWFYEAGRASAAATRAKVDELEQTGIEMLRERGMEVIEEIDRAPFEELAAVSWATYTDQFGDDMIERIQAVE
jgi:tripartite ATP-independent transporter DctP family solute receptor